MKQQVWRSHETVSLEITLRSVEITLKNNCGCYMKQKARRSHEAASVEITLSSKCGDRMRQQVW
jgi:hypothetical protein